jgi:hypothetical protein
MTAPQPSSALPLHALQALSVKKWVATVIEVPEEQLRFTPEIIWKGAFVNNAFWTLNKLERELALIGSDREERLSYAEFLIKKRLELLVQQGALMIWKQKPIKSTDESNRNRPIPERKGTKET